MLRKILPTAYRVLPTVQTLESRRLLAANVSAPPFTEIVGGAAAKSVQFTDVNGTQAQVMLTGGGTATVQFSGTGLSQSSNSRGLIVLGTNVAISSITVSGSSATSNLKIVTHGKHMLAVGAISAGGALGGIIAPGIQANDGITTGGGLHQLRIGGLSESGISIGSGKVSALVASLGSVSGGFIESAIPIASLSATGWSHGSAEDNPRITAPQIGALKITHDFTANVTAGSIQSIHIGGTISFSGINLTTPLTLGKDLGSMTVGGSMESMQIISGNSLGPISAGQMLDSTIYAGIVANPSAPLPTTSMDFRNTSQITSISFRRSDAASFKNSIIAAYTIGSTNLGAVPVTITGSPFGIAAHQINSATLVDQSSGKTVHVVKPATSNSFLAVLAEKGITPGSFEVSII